MNIDISIIIPVHNGGSYLEGTVSRLVKQRGVRFEIILVENNSSDDSWERCLKLVNKYKAVKAIKTELKGTNRARYIGVKQSIGRWVTFMDQDDSYITKQALMKMIAKVENDHDTLDIAQFGYFRGIRGIPVRKKITIATEKSIEINLSDKKNFSGLFFWTEKPVVTPNVWSKIYRGNLIRSSLTEMDFPLFFCEDMFINFLIFSSTDAKRFKTFSESFYCWNVGGVSSSDKAADKLLKEYCQIRPIIREYFVKINADQMIKQLYIDSVYYIKSCLEDKGVNLDIEEIVKSDFFQSIKSDPLVYTIVDPVISNYLCSVSAKDFYIQVCEH